MRNYYNRVFRPWAACVVLVLLASAVPAVSTQTSSVKGTVVKWQPVKLDNGSPVLFQITAPRNVQSVSATWLGHGISFFRPASASSWYGIAGVSLETAPGTYDLRLTKTFANGQTAQIVKKISIVRALYPKIPVRVAKQYTEPNPQQLTEVAADKGLKEKVFSVASAQRLWSGSFVAPATAPISDVFGTERVFNQEVQSRHQGLDYAVQSGTPVHAVNSGVVVLARPMFFEGNCIVIDHGQGLLSLYLHLSEFKVKEGEKVDSGQLIGLSGGTGRASGAHLHLAIRWQGIYLDPAILLKLNIPRAD